MSSKYLDAARRAHSSHAGRHISPSTNPLPKGQACSTCKARKVKCDAALPACSACRRTANFEGRDPTLVVCHYGSKACAGVKRKRPNKPRRRLSYASDDDYSPSSDDSSMYLAPASNRSRKERSDSGSSRTSTPSLSAESSNSWSSTSTVVEPSQLDAVVPLSLAALSVAQQPMFAPLMSQSPSSYTESSWSSMPLTRLGELQFEDSSSSHRDRHESMTPPSSAPLTPPPMSYALPEMPASLSFFEAAPSRSPAKVNPALLTPGFDLSSHSFNLSADPLADEVLFSMLGDPSKVGESTARPATPFLMTTPGGFNPDSLFEWTAFDYFAPRQSVP